MGKPTGEWEGERLCVCPLLSGVGGGVVGFTPGLLGCVSVWGPSEADSETRIWGQIVFRRVRGVGKEPGKRRWPVQGALPRQLPTWAPGAHQPTPTHCTAVLNTVTSSGHIE